MKAGHPQLRRFDRRNQPAGAFGRHQPAGVFQIKPVKLAGFGQLPRGFGEMGVVMQGLAA
jgi:hypothetical protein